MAFLRQITFNYNANGGAGAPGSSTNSYNISSFPATRTKQISSTKPSRTYYNFLGWAGSSGATSAAWASSQTLSFTWPDGNYQGFTQTFYAVWQHQTAYVYYNANGGSGAPSTQSHWAGYSVTLSATKPTRAKYIFLGWSQSSTATTASYQPNTSYALYNTVTLYAVWKKASDTVSAPNGTIGSAIALTITKIDNSYTDDITYSFGSVSGTIASGTTATTLSWTPPLSLASEIPNASSATCTFTCTTYSNGTLIGTTTKTITLTVPQSLAPTVSVSYADTIAKCLELGLFVQSRSKLAFTITASGQQGASIASYSASVNGSSYNSATFTTGVLLNNGSNSYSITVTDSRGLKKVSTGTFSVVAYSNPSLTLTLCDRNDSDSEQIDIGFDFAVSPVSNNNEAKYRIDYKLKSSSTWTNGTVQNLGAYSGSISDLIANLDGGDEWDIHINVIDSFQTSSIESEVGVSGNILLNSRHNGGLGILMKSQADNQCDIGKKTVFHETVDVIPRRAYATLSSSGWYRAIKLDFTGNPVGESLIMDIMINRSADYDSTLWECHSIRLVGSPLSAYFVNEKSNTTALRVTKIRLTHDGSGIYYVDIYTTSDAVNTYSVDFNVGTQAPNYGKITAESLQSVVSAPSGETILTTYTFSMAIPYIIESGTNSGWRYRKWSDGRIETWNVVSVSVTLSTLATYYHRGNATINLPFTFSDYESIQCTAYASTYWMSVNTRTSTSITLSIYDVVNGSGTVWISVHIIGKL